MPWPVLIGASLAVGYITALAVALGGLLNRAALRPRRPPSLATEGTGAGVAAASFVAAVREEEKAIEFYLARARHTNLPPVRDAFQRFAAAENRHVRLLRAWWRRREGSWVPEVHSPFHRGGAKR